MAKSTKNTTMRELKTIIKRMEEPRPSITLGRSDMATVLPILKKAAGE